MPGNWDLGNPSIMVDFHPSSPKPQPYSLPQPQHHHTSSGPCSQHGPQETHPFSSTSATLPCWHAPETNISRHPRPAAHWPFQPQTQPSTKPEAVALLWLCAVTRAVWRTGIAICTETSCSLQRREAERLVCPSVQLREHRREVWTPWSPLLTSLYA